MNGSEIRQDDEISFFDLWDKLKAGWRWVLGGTLAGVLCAVLALAVMSPRYEARVVLQTGRVAGSIIEDVLTVLERMKSPSLLLEVAQELDDQHWADNLRDGAGDNVLVASVPKTNTSVVEMKIKARSPELARKIADATTAKLIKRQDDLAAPILGKIRFDISVAKEKLAQIEKDILLLSKSLSSTGVKDERFSQVSLLTSMKLQKESEVFGLRQSIYTMEISLLPPATQPAKILEGIFVSEKPVSPKKGLLLALGFMGGLLAGVMLVFFADAYRRARQLRQESAAQSGTN